jgi:hypothetical protein
MGFGRTTGAHLRNRPVSLLVALSLQFGLLTLTTIHCTILCSNAYNAVNAVNAYNAYNAHNAHNAFNGFNAHNAHNAHNAYNAYNAYNGGDFQPGCLADQLLTGHTL